MSRTWSKQHGLTVGGLIAAIHLLFLLYLHFAYHSTYEGMVIFVVVYCLTDLFLFFLFLNVSVFFSM